MQSETEQDRAVKLREIEHITGLSKSSIYRREASGEFPQRILLGPKSSAWKLSEVRAWLNSRPRPRAA